MNDDDISKKNRKLAFILVLVALSFYLVFVLMHSFQ